MSLMNSRLSNDFPMSAEKSKLGKTQKATCELFSLPPTSRFAFQYMDLPTAPWHAQHFSFALPFMLSCLQGPSPPAPPPSFQSG